MGLNIAPSFQVIANDIDITDKLKQRFKSMRLTDETGTVSDTVEISLADHVPGEPIKLPPVGAELQVSIGYDGSLTKKGLFICDEIELRGYPGEMTLRGRAAPFDKSAGGKLDLQTQKTRTWKKGTTLSAMVNKMAAEHGLTAVVSSSLGSIALPVTVQSQESDMNLLLRLAKRYDAIAKPGGGKLVFAERGDSTSASGSALPTLTLTPADGSDWRVVISARDDAGTTVAYYRDIKGARRQQIAIGSGDPVIRLRLAYADAVSAEAAARSKHRERARGTHELTFQMPGNPAVTAEMLVTMQGFRDGVDGQWLVKGCEHYIGPDMGFVTSIRCEKPNSASSVQSASNVAADATQQVGVEV